MRNRRQPVVITLRDTLSVQLLLYIPYAPIAKMSIWYRKIVFYIPCLLVFLFLLSHSCNDDGDDIRFALDTRYFLRFGLSL